MFADLLQTKHSLRGMRICGLLLAGVLQLMSTGCSLLETCGCVSPPPPPPINQVTTFWMPEVRYVADTQRRNNQIPGLAGRLYLESSAGKALVEADGTVYADMYDATPGAPPTKIVEWTFNADSLKQLKKTDFVGMGYTLFLPWENYQPSVKRVQLRVTYVEKNNKQHIAEPEFITLRSADERPIVQQMNYNWTPDQHYETPKVK